MTNFEWLLRNKKEFVKILISNAMQLAVTKDGEATACTYHCEQCKFENEYKCSKKVFEWLDEEYVVPKPKLTKREHTLLSIFPNNLKWIVRNENGILCCFENKPDKFDISWNMVHGGEFNYSLEDIFGDIFEFITWNDSEPWAVSELLQLEVKDE